jgi:hypothetical protein
MQLPLTTSGGLTTVAKSRSAKRATKSSTLRAELERLSGHSAALRLALRDLGQHTDKVGGRLADHYVSINWWGETPEEIEPEEQHVIDLLKKYDASLRA